MRTCGTGEFHCFHTFRQCSLLAFVVRAWQQEAAKRRVLGYTYTVWVAAINRRCRAVFLWFSVMSNTQAIENYNVTANPDFPCWWFWLLALREPVNCRFPARAAALGILGACP